jgi:apolipoprotein N-acyltransferase
MAMLGGGIGRRAGSTGRDGPADEDRAGAGRDGWRVLRLGVLGAVTMFVVHPPFDLWPLAFVAPFPWLLLSRDGVGAARRPYASLWLAGFVHWMLLIHWLRLPHPATSIGWVALSTYLAAYLPLFVWGTRRLLVRHRWPLVAAAPVVWMGCEQLRGSILGGFTLGALGHTQWRFTELIQLADWAGAGGVGGIVMLVAAALVEIGATWRRPERGSEEARGTRPVLAAAVASMALVAALAYGRWRLATVPADPRSLDILLVQGSIDTELKHDPDAAGEVLAEYDGLTRAALGEGRRPDLVVWPETMWRWPILEIEPNYRLPADVVERILGPADERQGDGPGEGVESVAVRQARCRAILEQDRLDPLAAHARRYATTWLVGVDRQLASDRSPDGVLHFNSALFLDSGGVPAGRYDKMFPVMFGETVPLADRFPILYRLTPLPAGLTAGTEPVVVTVAGLRVAPTICYETALPGAIRTVVNRSAAAGARPDILVNLTNDGWFWGSSELDMHLASAIFRAVEVRTPLAIAANTGFSAVIDGCGRLLERGPRRATGTIRAAVHPDGRTSPWLLAGPVAAATCAGLVLLLMVEAWFFCRRRVGPATLTSAPTLPARHGGVDGVQNR